MFQSPMAERLVPYINRHWSKWAGKTDRQARLWMHCCQVIVFKYNQIKSSWQCQLETESLIILPLKISKDNSQSALSSHVQKRLACKIKPELKFCIFPCCHGFWIFRQLSYFSSTCLLVRSLPFPSLTSESFSPRDLQLCYKGHHLFLLQK